MHRKMPMDRMPPIATLRALETAARHLSFTKAANELNVTQSAISHQIRHLEDVWGLKLFGRRPRQLTLTRNGRALANVVREFLDQMAGTLETLRAGEFRGPLRVSLPQSFAIKWLVPRLGGFYSDHPDINIWISTSYEFVDFATDEADVAIRLGHGNYQGLHTTPLLREYAFPVCSPLFLERTARPSAPKDLLAYPLLHKLDKDIAPDWTDWFHAAGVDNADIIDGPRFPDTSMAIQAAIDGQGIVLARSAHVGDDLAAGRLIRLFDVRLPSTTAYYFVCPKGTETRPKITLFRDWITREAALSQAEYDETMT